MRSHQTTEITVQTARIVIIRRCRSIRGWCEPCGGVVDLVGLDEAGSIAGIEQPMLRAHSVVRDWHVCEGQNGELLVCLDSLIKSL